MGQNFSLNWLRNDLRRAIGKDDIDLAMVDRALDLAFRYHDGQFRESADAIKARVPYITHPVGVAKNCAAHFAAVHIEDDLATVLAAALAHDLLEDTSLDFSELQCQTSARVAELVQNLTKPSAGQFKDRTERNRRFLERIEQGDATTRFIKICDALHNLSRPNAMPTSLLSKTIRKAKRDYLPLALDPRFGDELHASLLKVIDEAETQKCYDVEAPASPATLDEFLSYCVERASGKVLEQHDVQDTILELKGVSAITSDTLDGFATRVLSGMIGDNQQNTKDNLKTKLLNRGEIVLTGKPFLPEKVQTLPFQRVISLPVGTGGSSLHDRTYLFLGLNASQARPWVSVSSLRAAASILTERAREREARILSEYVDWVAASSLRIDPRIARDLGMSHEQVSALATLLEAANAEMGAMSDAIRFLVESNARDGEVLSIDHRAKQPLSAATKLLKRDDGDIEALDDVLGLRIVTLNTRVARCIVETIEKTIGRTGMVQGANRSLVEGTFDVRAIDTVHGYSATHVVFQITSSYHAGVSIPCEIQVRTLFQDAWARVAHDNYYKSGSRTPRAVKKCLQVLADTCARADEITDRLAKGV